MFKKLLTAFGVGRAPEKLAEKKKFLEVMDEWYERTKTHESFRQSTIVKITYMIETVKDFFVTAGYQNLPIDEVRVRHMEEFRTWLKTEKKYKKVSYSSRLIELCKRVMKYACLMEYTLNDPLRSIPNKRDPAKTVVFLEQFEVQRLVMTQFANNMYSEIRDLFIFQCYTGLAYADIFEYKIERKDQKLWIVSQRIKTGRDYHIPLFEPAKVIHEKYNGKLPCYANQTYNRILKELAKIAGIKKNLTTHVGRKTFASLRDQEGFSPKAIADMLGNTIAITEKHYLGEGTKRIENEMDKLGIHQTLNN